MLSASLLEAVALSLDIEPESLLIDWRDADYSDPFEDCPREFKRRMAIALNHAKDGALPLTSLAFTDPPFSPIRLKDFADWAGSLGWSLPDRFPRACPESPATDREEILTSTQIEGEQALTPRRATMKAEKDCLEWLLKLMKKPSNPTKNRDEYKAEAADKFGVGARAFGRAWGHSIRESANTNWGNPGRKSKQRIDTPV
jgi:hypothetical protein